MSNGLFISLLVTGNCPSSDGNPTEGQVAGGKEEGTGG